MDYCFSLALMEAASFSFFFKKEKIQRTAGTLPADKGWFFASNLVLNE